MKNDWQAEGGVAQPKRGVRADGSAVVSFQLVVRERGEEHFLRCECDATDRAEEWEEKLKPGRYVAVRGRWLTRPYKRRGVVVASIEYCHVDELTFPERASAPAGSGGAAADEGGAAAPAPVDFAAMVEARSQA